MRFVDPSVEALGAFLTVDGVTVGVADAAVEPAAAEYMIDAINLNSGAHRRRRHRRQEIATKLGTLEAMLQVFREALPTPAVSEEIERAEADLRDLRGVLGAASPWDRPTTCRCP